MKDFARVKAIVTGRVQGVGFRSFVRRNAIVSGLSGWVRNRFDGSVEFVVEGERNTIEKFLVAIKQGNRFSHVNTVNCVWEKAEGIVGFEVEY